MDQAKGLKLFNMPFPMFCFITFIVLLCTYIGVLPPGMTGCFIFMIVVGTWLDFIGNKAPIIKDYFGGGAIVVLFGVAALHYFHLLPEIVKDADGNVTATYMQLWKEYDLVGNISTFFKPTGAFLDWYIAALITGSILGMNRKLLVKAASRYFPAIFGAIILSFALCTGAAAIMGYGAIKGMLLIALPIMGGGMGAGASPLSKIFDAAGTMTAAEALSIMTPAVAIGNAISIVLGGLFVKVFKSNLWNGNGALMQAGSIDPKELEISPEMQQKRDSISVTNLGIGLLISGAFFSWGYICAGVWEKLVPAVTVHAYAFMIITVAIFKIGNFLPEWAEIACYQWFQFIMKNLTNVLLMGIGLCYLDLGQVISSFSLTYLVLCGLTVIGAFFGAALIGRLVGFYPVEAGITAGLCMANMGGTGDVAVLSAANRMELMPFAQISSRLGGAIILLIGSLLLSTLGGML
ncbi:MAG: 2-hydroxycarboxylate transporter family protein [Lachnospiraceae bacterium]|nr:2-hydroxycarboxylate transporter family protein [Lachnospiraceae bacterium]